MAANRPSLLNTNFLRYLSQEFARYSGQNGEVGKQEARQAYNDWARQFQPKQKISQDTFQADFKTMANLHDGPKGLDQAIQIQDVKRAVKRDEIRREGDSLYFMAGKKKVLLAAGKEKADALQAILPGSMEEITMKQQNVGNCWFIGTLDALIQHPNPEFLTRLLQGIDYDPKKQEYRVTFPGAPDKTYAVPKQKLDNFKSPDDNKPIESSHKVVNLLEHAAVAYARDTSNHGLKPGWSLSKDELNKEPDKYNKLDSDSLEWLHQGKTSDAWQLLTNADDNGKGYPIASQLVPQQRPRSLREAFTLHVTSIGRFCTNRPNRLILLNSQHSKEVQEKPWYKRLSERLKGNHTYVLRGTNSAGDLRLVDPHDTSREILVSEKDARAFFTRVETFQRDEK